MLDDLGRYEEAAASCDKALSINPNFADAWVMRGVALGKLGQYSEVLTSSDKALTINPNSVEAWNNRGSALDDLGRYEEAVASYDKALTINPNYVDALSNRGNSLKKLGQYTEAFALNNKALAIEQQNREKEDRKIQIQPIKEIPQPFTPKKLPRDLSEKGLTHHDIIITYSNKDKPIADGVCASLESHSLRCWIAPRDVPPGEDFPKAIIKAINGSKIMILIFSSYSNTSPHVTRELTKAVSNGVIIIPFRIEDVPLSESMEYLIGLPHWLDAVTPPLENHIDKLVKTVDAILNK
jgi:tetratricopeptide (TPR) repeat protein